MTGPNNILIVEDDVEFAEMVREYLQIEGFTVDLAHDWNGCFKSRPESKALIVLDVMLPGKSGFEILKAIRRQSAVPILMLTARDSDTDRIVGLEIGADDYVAKPVNPRELVARIRAILRRSTMLHADPTTDITVGDVKLNSASRTAWRGDEALELTTAEFNLLEHLLRNPGKTLRRDALSAAAFDRHQGIKTDRNVDTLVSKLRRKLGANEDAEHTIKTIRNVGYLYAAVKEQTAEEYAGVSHTL